LHYVGLTGKANSVASSNYVSSPNLATVQKKRVIVREASFQDHAKVFELQSRYGLQESYRSWVHLWVENPVLKGLKGWPIGWVIENESEQSVVGYLGNIPQIYEIGREKVIAAASRAWVVDERFRSYSILLLDKFLSQRNAQLCLATTSNSKASPIVEAAGGLQVPVGAWDEADFWITNHREFVAGILAMKRVIFGRYLSYPLGACSRLADSIWAGAFRKSYETAQLTRCAGFDQHFDEFWNEIRIRSPHLLGLRTREILQWHFKEALADGRLWIVAAFRNNRLHAYSIFVRKDSPALQLTRVMLVDFQSLDGDVALLPPMIKWALDKCTQERIHMLEIVGLSDRKRKFIRKLAPHTRRLSSWPYYYKASDKSIAALLTNPSVWDPSMFDGDASL
jgi:hypothetical protein